VIHEVQTNGVANRVVNPRGGSRGRCHLCVYNSGVMVRPRRGAEIEPKKKKRKEKYMNGRVVCLFKNIARV